MNGPAFAPAFAAARPVAAPAALRSNHAPRTFDLHPVLHVAVFAGFGLYLAVMWAAFGEAELALPFVIFAVTLAAGFVVPAYWARVAGDDAPKAGGDEFLRQGVDCNTGWLSGNAVLAQVLIMPAMLVLWGVGIAIIAAAV